MIRAIFPPLLLCAALPLALQARQHVDNVSPRPVLVGGFMHADSCTSTGTIGPLEQGGDGFVAVRAAPGTAARMLDRLKPGRPLWLCRDSANGQWVGVVYPDDENGMPDCGVSDTAHDKPAPYTGPCKSGWVMRRFIALSAG
jgi:hypothetical protein